MNNQKTIHVNSPLAWILASRPKTLTGAASPVIVGGVLALITTLQNGGECSIFNFVACLLFALTMQIAANFINDYFDYQKGTDRNEDRLGPQRACAQKWITPKAMKIGIALTLIIACSFGLTILIHSSEFIISHTYLLIIVGILCVIFAFAYTTHFSYLGLGDILVILFFGIIPVYFTFLVTSNSTTFHLSDRIGIATLMFGVAQGLVTDLLLMVNNYRDYNQDIISKKKTLVVRFGPRFGRNSYLLIGVIASVLAIWGKIIITSDITISSLIIILWLLLCHYPTYSKLRKLQGRELNKVLGTTARNIVLFAITLSIIILC